MAGKFKYFRFKFVKYSVLHYCLGNVNKLQTYRKSGRTVECERGSGAGQLTFQKKVALELTKHNDFQ